MDTGVIQLSLLSRSLGPACSNVRFLFLGIKRRLFRAYGVPGGAVLIQRLPVTKNDLLKDAVTTEVVIDGVHSPTSNRIEDVELVAFNQADSYLLAAATATHLTVYSLLPFHEATSAPLPPQTPLYGRLLSVPFPGIVAMEWTGDGEGLLLSDQRCQITCMTISIQQNDVPTTTLSRRSLVSAPTGSVEIEWVQKLALPQQILAPGGTLNHCFAAATVQRREVKIVSSADSALQEISASSPVVGLMWSPIRQGMASMKPCLLTVESTGILRIWVEAPRTVLPYLGSSPLQSPSSSHAVSYQLELTIPAADSDIVPRSMRACWVETHWNAEEDPKLAWIVGTYHVKKGDSVEEWCAVYVIDGLPVELAGTQISGAHLTAYLHSTCKVGTHRLPVTSLCAVLLRSDPAPQILLCEAGRRRDLAETRSIILNVEMASQETLKMQLENSSVQEIVGFTSPVTQLVTHPRYDCVCVLTEARVVSVWDLWPVRQLCRIRATAFDLGNGIYALTWLELSHHYGELGHLLLLGDQGAAICLLTSNQQQGKPVVTVQPLSNLAFSNSLYTLSLMLLHSCSDRAHHERVLLVRARSVDAEIDDDQEADVYRILTIQQQLSHDIEMSLSPELHPFGINAASYTVLDRVQHSAGSIVSGTRDGTLEFFKCTEISPFNLEHVSSCALSSESHHPSFISCLSTCAHASYIACVTSFDEHQNEDKIHILQSESTCGSLDYRLEDSFVSSSGIISQTSWTQTPSPYLTLVVGYQAGQVDILVRKRQGLWVPVGKYVSSLEMTTLAATRQGLPVVGSGHHMLFLSSDSHDFNIQSLDDNSVMQAALSVGGAFPDYHHIPLLTLLQIGHLQSIGVALREMVEFLKKWERTPENERLEEIFAPTVNGPSSLLEETFSEAIVSSLEGMRCGDEIVHCEPFSFKDVSEPAEQQTIQAEKAEQKQDTAQRMEDSGLLTGQFDMSQFNNQFSEPPKAPPVAAESGLLDMSAFGMSFAAESSSESEPEPQMPSETPLATEQPPEESVEAVNGDRKAPVEMEDCLLFSLEAAFNERFHRMLKMGAVADVPFDRGYVHSVLEKYIASNEALPLNCLLKLSKTHASILLDVSQMHSSWTSELTKMPLDVPGTKFLAAVKLTALSSKCQPKRAESKNNLSDFRREDYLPPFVRSQTDLSMLSKASVASSATSTSLVDNRLTESYISWPESVGILSGIEAIHILWALETDQPSQLLSACLEATAEKRHHPWRQVVYSWERLRAIGAGFWIRDRETATKVAEEIARDAFKKSNDPHDCALMYIALKKQTLLSRLFRSNGYPRVADLLSKDFSQEHHQQAAAKNAFVLLGQHRYSLAAAFFLVGGHFQDAIGVCAKEMQDPQLALFLTHLLDVPDEQLTQDIITKEILPHAVAADDRVAQGVLLWLMERKMEALKAITTVKALKSELSIHDRAVSKILLLQFVLWRGLAQLDGRYVPLWMFEQIQHTAAHCAHVLEACGMPSLALKALQTCRSLEKLLPNAQESTLYKSWSTRLVTALLITHLPSPHVI